MTMEPGTLLADDAQTADRTFGPCTLCKRATLTGQRVARMPGDRWIHTYCADAITPGMLAGRHGPAARRPR